MIHLHVHSNFSFLDGASPAERLLKRAAELEMPALGLTDHHGLYGVVRFIQAAKLYGIKPIIGTEICICNTTKSEPHHLILLAKDGQGYGNLCRIVTKAQLDYQDDPQIALQDLAPLSEGLIALSACRRGEVASHLLAQEREKAIDAAQQYAEVFGENFWIEIEHHLLPDDTFLVESLLDVAKETNLRCVVTNDVHYAYPDEYRLRDVMACIQTRTTLDEWSDVRHVNGEYYLKTKAEMREAFGLPDEVFNECLAATEEIADSCNLELLAVSCRPPDFPVPRAETAFSYLYKLCQEGVNRLYRPLTAEVSNQLAHELSVIEEMGLASFFLCVWDIVRFSRERGIRCAGRGSAADSIVAYVLGITTVDPIANNLLFERFLNPGRVGMPDVDIDFDSRRRDEVIEYIENRYTTEHAAMVANVITYRSRSAFRDVAKSMGFSPSAIDHLASKLSYRGVEHMREELVLAGVLPSLPGSTKASKSDVARPSMAEEDEAEIKRYDLSLPKPQNVAHIGSPITRSGAQALNANPVGTTASQPHALLQALELCEQLDGYPRHLSLHNGGMLITAEPLTDVVPLEYATSGVRVCQFNKDDVEVMGLIKFDILGLRTLSIVDEAVRMVSEGRGIEIPIDEIPLDDPAVYDVICSSKTIGIFQIESPGQWTLLQRAQPRHFADLIIQIALFRPGPLQGGMVDPYIERRLGREEISYPHPSLVNCLKDTLGVVIFQEQVLQVAHDFAGLSYADADGLRRAMSHYRTNEEMDVCRDIFVEKAVELGRDRELAKFIYERITYFSGYGFCRSHAAAFAKTVYQTAFLKTYYPAEFLAAILSNEPCCYYPPQTVIEEARKWGIRVLPVDINKSKARYSTELDANGRVAIRMGLMQVKALTEDTAQKVIDARGNWNFSSLSNFWRRASLNRDAVENLIAVGAFDSLGVNRRKLLWQAGYESQASHQSPVASRKRVSSLQSHAAGESQYLPLKVEEPPVPDLPPLNELDMASLDFTLQGTSAEFSIMSFYRRSLDAARIPTIGQLQGKAAGTTVRTAGIVISRQQPPTAKGVTFLVLADEEGELPVAIFPNVYQQYRQVINSNTSLVIEGTVEREGYLVSMVGYHFWSLNDTAQLDSKPVSGHQQAHLSTSSEP